MIILTFQLDWRNKYLQQSWAPLDLHCISMPNCLMIFERIFWKIGTVLAQGCFCKEIWNTILLPLFYWQTPQHFIKKCYSPISHVSKHQADKLGRLTLPQASMGRASSTNLALQAPSGASPATLGDVRFI